MVPSFLIESATAMACKSSICTSSPDVSGTKQSSIMTGHHHVVQTRDHLHHFHEGVLGYCAGGKS